MEWGLKNLGPPHMAEREALRSSLAAAEPSGPHDRGVLLGGG
jgi:hypothetical protein